MQQPVKSEQPLAVDEKVKDKAKKIQLVVGGVEADFYQILTEFQDLAIEDIITHILAEREMKETPNGSNSQMNTPQPKREEAEKKANKKKVLKKNYSNQVKEKAQAIFSVIGGSAEDYYEICDNYSLNDSNFILDLILNDGAILDKFTSYNYV